MNQTAVKKRVVGVDISSELTTYAIVDVRGNILAKDNFPTMDYPEINGFVTTLCERIVGLVELNGGYESIRSIGVSAASANFLTGCIVNAANMPWKGVIPLAAMMRDQLGLAVAVANNSHVVGLGEQAFGAAHGMREFVAVTLGSGMGSSIFSEGEVNLGYDGYAGEIGHTCVEFNGRLCGCGNRGCLETYTAAKGIVKTAQEVMAESDEPSLMRGEEKLTPKKIYEFCEQGDELAIEVYRRTGEILGLGLANYASLLNPEAIIFTGGIVHAGHWLLEPAKKSFEEHVFHNIQGKVKFLTSDLSESERNVLGASVLAWKVKEYSLFKE
jgi:glucokinase